MNVYESIMQGLSEAVEYERGSLSAKKTKCTVAPLPQFSAEEIKSVRNSLAMSQSTFAQVMGVPVKTVEAWESGTNSPIGPARRMLSMLQTDSKLPFKYSIIST